MVIVTEIPSIRRFAVSPPCAHLGAVRTQKLIEVALMG